MKVYKGH